MGKSTTARILVEHGVPVIDSDDLARAVVEPGEPALEEIRREFGDGVLRADGCLDRGALAKIVFSDDGKRGVLEAILHPRIRDLWLAQVEEWRGEGREVCAVVVPLLYETRGDLHCDKVLCLACSAPTQEERLRVRGWSEEHIRQRVAAQWPVEQKMELADYVVWSEGRLEVHRRQLERILWSIDVSVR